MKPQIVGKRVKALIKSRGINVKELAKDLDITEQELMKKLEGKKEFYVSEVIMMTELLDLTIKSVAEIFFTEETDNKKEKNETKKKA